jgi:hypothetical protein
LLPLAYGPGGAAGGVGLGAPAQNNFLRHYFTGRSDNFDPDHNSGFPFDARFDTEGIRISNDGLTVFISDEYGPCLYQFLRHRRTSAHLHVAQIVLRRNPKRDRRRRNRSEHQRPRFVVRRGSKNHELFVAKGGERVDGAGASGWEESGERGDGGENGDCQGRGRQIRRCDAVKLG